MNTSNIGSLITAPGSDKPFSALITDLIPDLAVWGSGSSRFFPRYAYIPVEDDGGFDLGQEDDVIDGHRRVDNISDSALRDYRAAYGENVTKDQVFYYVYGLLHSPMYRAEFAADLKKMLPRIPMVNSFTDFEEAGRNLANLHLNYETVEPYELDEVVTSVGTDEELYRVQKMTFGKGMNAKDKDRSRIVYNSRITVTGIPEEAYRYMLASRSAIEWIMDRYQALCAG